MAALNGKVVIITGASSGIGEATARALVAAGARVVLGARRESRLSALVDELGEGNAVAREADVTSFSDMRALVELAVDSFGRADAMFANAGIMPAGAMSELKLDDWMSMVDVNVKGVLNAMAAALPVFLSQKHGHIVVTSSCAGLRAVPGNAVYAGTKHFVRAMLDSFRMEAASERSGIRTTLVYPGAIKTELLDAVAPSQTKDAVEKFYEEVGLEPAVIADAVVYALSQPDNVDVSDLVVRPSLEA